MIKVRKSQSAPESLVRTKRYDGEDVKLQLLLDQDSKCYICERLLGTDFEIEHFAGREGELFQKWSNLLLSCGYCNRKKSSMYNLLNPLQNNIEDEIQQRLNINTKKVEFVSHGSSDEIEALKVLLGTIFNGRGRFRDVKEQQFWAEFISKIDYFNQLLLQYIEEPINANAEKVRNELSLESEFLGFKYWIIKDNSLEEFYPDIVWNK